MQERIVKNKINIFISSNCNRTFAIIRESLKMMLIETGFCQVYVFEETNATSYDVEQSYMHPLTKCDLVVFLIDNNEPLGEGTLKEVKRAKELQKKCIYLFCDELERKPTELQNELKNNLYEKYQVVSKLSHVAEEAYKSVINDIMDIYSLYCAKELEKIKVRKNEDDKDESEGITIENIENTLRRDIYTGYKYTKTILNNNIIYQHKEPLQIKGFDFLCADMMQVLIGNKKITDIDYDSLKKNVLELHTGRLKSVVDNRLDAIYEYFIGNLEKAELKLKEALKISRETKKIPSWISNDIAIDLRNVEVEIGYAKNEFRYKTEGQAILDGNDELVYYPVLDRFSADYYKSVIEDFLNEQLDMPFTTHMGGVDHIINQTVDIFIAGLSYGSITHVLNIREKLYVFLQNSCVQTRNHKMFVFTIKIMLLIGKKKELKRFLRAYGEYTDSVNDEDVCSWEKAIDGIGIKYQRFHSQLILFGFFGSYFEDNHFENYYKIIKKEIEKWFKEQYADDIIVKAYLEAIEENQYRIAQKEILEIAYNFFKHNFRRWYDDVFKLIKSVSLDKLSTEEINKCVEWIGQCATDNNIKEHCYRLPQVIQHIRLNIGDCETLDILVKDNFPAFYNDTYSLNVFTHKEDESWVHIKRHIESIKAQNETQGKGGAYSGYAVNAYGTILNIICHDKVKLNTKQLQELMDALIGTMASERQTFEAKSEALWLMIFLKIRFPKMKCVDVAISTIIENEEVYLRGNDLFLRDGFDEGTIHFIYGLLQLLDSRNEVQFVELFAKMSKEIIETNINVLKMLIKLLENGYIKNISEASQYALIQYLYESSMHFDRNIRLFSYIALIKILGQNQIFSEIILSRLSKAMDGEVYENKIAILSRLPKDSTEINKYIFEKGKVDNHYWVRCVANR